MGEKGKKRDILSDILNNVNEGAIEDLESLNAIIEAEGAGGSGTDKTEKNTSAKIARKRPKKKTSHYLSKAVYEALDDAKTDLRDLLPDLPESNVNKSEITKSNIVDIALKTILEEYKEKGLQSTLIQKLLSKK